jgi:hypothetical protein
VTKKKKTKKKAAAPAVNPEANENATVAVAEVKATHVAEGEIETGQHGGAGTSPAPAKSKGKKRADGPTLAELADRYLENLAEIGKSRGTCFSYRGELELAIEWLGAETKLADLGAPQVQGFFECPAVTRTRTGKPKSPLSIAKTRRVLRQALVFAVGAGWIEAAPLPDTTKAA